MVAKNHVWQGTTLQLSTGGIYLIANYGQALNKVIILNFVHHLEVPFLLSSMHTPCACAWGSYSIRPNRTLELFSPLHLMTQLQSQFPKCCLEKTHNDGLTVSQK
jgi:hypothetical protein